ncbi:hypothetical protein P171DRAFT_132138 [Karstenula rhodostoma CBS 690.94]|uniref:Uncharacterized protein n=1 Tax=Karstenula rhodostoma CBS 690.94 TaxID=1392251 RepID=A0A9P4P957_9PLEO|nr:hypothetical protein P171DRAFT_132138 [Karstenula rhodostoma CBS 690.94]
MPWTEQRNHPQTCHWTSATPKTTWRTWRTHQSRRLQRHTHEGRRPIYRRPKPDRWHHPYPPLDLRTAAQTQDPLTKHVDAPPRRMRSATVPHQLQSRQSRRHALDAKSSQYRRHATRKTTLTSPISQNRVTRFCTRRPIN